MDIVKKVADCLFGEESNVSRRFSGIQAVVVSELPGMSDAIESAGNPRRTPLCWLGKVGVFDLDATY